MAATQTVPQLPQSHKLLVPRLGVVTLFGYGIKVYVDRGHLVLHDGIGGDRREARLPRVGHGLRRLVVIGSDGMVSPTGPVRPSDARLRRAQALAHKSGIALNR